MPWTIFWGANFHAFVAAQQIGTPPPAAVASAPAAAPDHGGHDGHLPWALQGAARPAAAPHDRIGPDGAAAIAAARGLAPPWVLDLPGAPGRPYRLSAAAERTGEVRVIQIDPGGGAVLQDIRFGDLGIGARAFQWGIYTHQGQQFGEANRLVMLGGCIGLLLLALSAPVMWWKGRGRGHRPAPGDGRASRGLIVLFAATGILFPLTGATMLAAAVATWVVRATAKRRRT